MYGDTMKKQKKLFSRFIFNMVLFGLIGNLAWVIENMYFNTFLYNSVYDEGKALAHISSMSAIRYMVAFSAITAVITTFIMGHLSDRLNKRKMFISIGFIIWGITVISFGFITKTNVAKIFQINNAVKIVTVTAIIVIVMDSVMTFFGSTAFDSAYNAWITDITDHSNRATAESIISILPVAATIIMIAFGGMIGTIGYKMFFFSIGLLVSFSGLLGLLTLKDSEKSSKKQNGKFLKEILYGFKPSVIKENKKLYTSLLAVLIFQTAMQIFMPYILIYLEHSLNFNVESLNGYITKPVLIAIPFIIILLVSIIILIGKMIDKLGKNIFMFVAIILMTIGLCLCFFIRKTLPFIIFMALAFFGYGIIGIIINASVRDYTPENKVGLFQGVRMIFNVMLPMIIGPAIGDAVCKIYGTGTYMSDVGSVVYEPCAEMFLAAAILTSLLFIPCISLIKQENYK